MVSGVPGFEGEGDVTASFSVVLGGRWPSPEVECREPSLKIGVRWPRSGGAALNVSHKFHETNTLKIEPWQPISP